MRSRDSGSAVVRYVDDAAELGPVLAACAESSVLAVDTEFERSVTFRPRPALIQLRAGESIWLLDPLAVPQLARLGELLSAPAPLKIMHGPLEDLEVLALATGREPAPLFDTQLAAAFAGVGFGMGYPALAKALLDVDVSKDQTRSDWLRRPLSEAQLRYAAEDVTHLPAMHRILHERLEASSRLSWLDEETRLARERARENGVERDFARLAGRVGDSDARRGALHALCAWRDREARRRDLPRRHVAADELLLALAEAPARDVGALEALDTWRAHRGGARASELVSASTRAHRAPPVPLPKEAMDLSAYRSTLGCMKRAVRSAAKSAGLEPALLAPRRLIEKALIHARVCGRPGLPTEFRGWRAPLLEAPLMECLRHA